MIEMVGEKTEELSVVTREKIEVTEVEIEGEIAGGQSQETVMEDIEHVNGELCPLRRMRKEEII